MFPNYETVLKYCNQYKRVPVAMELYADQFTLIEVLRILRQASNHCYLLESASQDEQWGRYSFLGYNPTYEITCFNHLLKIKNVQTNLVEEKEVGHPKDEIRKILKKISFSND